jgi:hypothetical protein
VISSSKTHLFVISPTSSGGINRAKRFEHLQLLKKKEEEDTFLLILSEAASL